MKKIAGVAVIVVGAVAISQFFLVSGVLFVIVGVSLLMDVRIWRR